jgi:hypothetical protein
MTHDEAGALHLPDRGCRAAADWNIWPPSGNGVLIVCCPGSKAAKLARNEALRRYVQGWLSGAVTASDGVRIRGPNVTGKHVARDAGSTRSGGDGVEPGTDCQVAAVRLSR